MTDFASLPWAELAPFIAIGFLAQLVDGALGMAFGVISSALLVVLGVPPVAASAAIHTAESFTSGVSGLSHAAQRNIDWPLFARLVIPGVVGGLAGAWLIVNLDADAARPVVLVYLAAVGLYLIWRGPRRPRSYRRLRFVRPLGLVGGLLDSSGGGGWGPIVTGNLLAQGAPPRTVIGTVSASEFFVTVTISMAFIGTLSLASFTLAATGLLIGGLAAAPIGAYLARRVAPAPLMVLVGGLLVAGSLYGLGAMMVGATPAYPNF